MLPTPGTRWTVFLVLARISSISIQESTGLVAEQTRRWSLIQFQSITTDGVALLQHLPRRHVTRIRDGVITACRRGCVPETPVAVERPVCNRGASCFSSEEPSNCAHLHGGRKTRSPKRKKGQIVPYFGMAEASAGFTNKRQDVIVLLQAAACSEGFAQEQGTAQPLVRAISMAI